MFKLDEPLRDYHRASIKMTHKQKPSQSIIILFTARTNARHTLFSPSSPADAQLRPGSAAMSPGGIGANAGLSPRRRTDRRTGPRRPAAAPRAALRPAEPSGRGHGAPSWPPAPALPPRPGGAGQDGARSAERKKRRARCRATRPGLGRALQPRSGRAGRERAPPRHGDQVRNRGHSATHRHLRRPLRPCWGRTRRAPRRPRLREAPVSLLPPLSSSFAAAALPGPPHPALPQPRRQPPPRPSRPPLSCDPRRGGGEAGPGRIRAAAVDEVGCPRRALSSPQGAAVPRAAGSLPAAVCFLVFPARPGGARCPA